MIRFCCAPCARWDGMTRIWELPLAYGNTPTKTTLTMHLPFLFCSDYEKDIKSFAQFTPEHVVLAVVTFLKVVTEGKSTLKPRLPTGAAGRHRYCTLVGKKITVKPPLWRTVLRHSVRLKHSPPPTLCTGSWLPRRCLVQSVPVPQ